MADLADLQRDIIQALRAPAATPAAAAWIVGGAALAERRLAIYRANLAANAEKALAAAYPVARQLVGADFFSALARAYLDTHPSTSGDLGEFGEQLPDFAAGFEPARALPWLPDLARLEWAAHRAFSAADAPPWEASALAAVPAADQDRLRFAWAPGLALVASRWPVARLWNIHQPGWAGEFSIDWSHAEHALVARVDFQLTVRALGPGDAAFMDRSLRGAMLGEAVEAALAAEPAFDLGALLGRLVAAGQVCGCALDERP